MIRFSVGEMASTIQYPYRLSLTERAGGWVLAVCLHVMLFSALVLVKPLPAADPPLVSQPIKISFQEDIPPEPAGDPAETALASVIAFEPAAAMDSESEGVENGDKDGTDAEGSAKKDKPGASEGDGEDESAVSDVQKFLNRDYMAAITPAETKPAAETPAAESGGPEATTTDPKAAPAADGSGGDYAQIVATMRARAEEMNRQNELARMEGSKAFAGKLMSAHAKAGADKTLFSADPLHSGVIRTVETTGVPNNVADEVLMRNGFTVKIMQMAGGVKGGDYLSGIQTGAGKFVNTTTQPGMYRVLFLSDQTVRRLVQLETEEMSKKGYDSNKVRLKKVVFGVVSAGKTYELAVTKMEVEPIKK